MIRSIVVAMSGGVDSTVAAFILRKKGYKVQGVFMQNWSEADEGGVCTTEQDYKSAVKACEIVDIPLHRVDFQKEYWLNVFSHVLAGYENGITPNPDVLCNRHIKFGVLYNYVFEKMGADWLATGHYARLKYSSEGIMIRSIVVAMSGGVDSTVAAFILRKKGVRLMRAKDEQKDQTFFLSQVHQQALQKTLFPLGNLLKRDVKKIAAKYISETYAKRKESTGLCFIGKRNFGDFIDQVGLEESQSRLSLKKQGLAKLGWQYISKEPGEMVDIDTGQVITNHSGIHKWTVGQRPMIGNQLKAYYIVKIDAASNTIFLAGGKDHPARLCYKFTASNIHWISKEYKIQFDDTNELKCGCRTRHQNKITPCVINQHWQQSEILVTLKDPLVGLVAPGQQAVFYNLDECIGSAQIFDHNPQSSD